MVYVAQRVIKKVDRDCKVTIYRPGDEIEDFASWNIHARRAHLNMHLVTKEDKVIAVEPRPIEPEPEEELDFEPDPDAESESVKCGHCSREFKSKTALKVHIRRAHP